MKINHSVVTAEPDDPTKDVSADAWNADHVVEGPVYRQSKYAGTQVTTVVFDVTPLQSSRIILGINRLGTSTVSSVSSTNTTWTMVNQFVTGGSCLELWVGVCAASPGSTITFTAGSSNFNSARAIEILSPALTPTVGVSYAAVGSTGTLTGVTAGNHVIGMATHVNTTIASTSAPAPPIGGPPAVGFGTAAIIVPLWIALSEGTSFEADGNGASALLMTEVS